MPNKVNILVVDDSPDKLLTMETILEELQERVVAVSSGEEALRQLLRKDYAVILLDVNMPGMDGFETAGLIRQRARSAHTPIIFVTAFSEETHVQQGYSLGAVDYILTPVIPEVLRAKVAVFVDLFRKTEQVRRYGEQQVILAQEQAARLVAEESNRAKSAFLANISHELRTPMNAIIGMTELALNEELTPVVRDYLETVQSSADMLLALLNEILDFSRLESGKLILESTPFGLREMVDDTVKALRGKSLEKGLKLFCDIPDDIPDRVIGDPLRLRQVLTNLIGNAIKFTAQGEVALRLRAESTGRNTMMLTCAVADTGIGISARDQKRIFAPFTQADSSTTRLYGGTGLGLAIASNLVGLAGGRLWVESVLGRGSTFYFTIRLQLERGKDLTPSFDAPASTELKRDNQRALRILLAEDTPANQKLIVALLAKKGHTIHVANNGQEAIDILRKQRYDLVLMDVQMPVMDGLQATAAIRAMQTLDARTPIIAMTAHAMRGDEERCLNAGMDAYITKPVDSRKLIDLIEITVRPPQVGQITSS